MNTASWNEALDVRIPLLCGAMYPCSNPELVAAVSEAGGIGIVQPISLTYVHGHTFKEGLQFIRTLTSKPIGLNVLIEGSNKTYLKRMSLYVDQALEEGIRFFVTSLGNPRWVVDRVKQAGGVVFHDVTEKHWAEKAVQGGVDGLIAVNNRAGGHAGGRDSRYLFDVLAPLGKPILCAGGVGDAAGFTEALKAGYAGVQMGTRFIATTECRAHADYKAAIVAAKEADIVLTDRISGVPVSVIRTPYVARTGTHAGPIARFLLRGRKTKHWMRTFYTLKSVWQLKRGLSQSSEKNDYWQAGKSVNAIDRVEPAGAIVQRFAVAFEAHRKDRRKP